MNRFLNFLILLSLILPVSLSLAQDRERRDIGNLLDELEHTKDYFDKAKLLYEIGDAYHYSRKDSSIYFYKQALEAATIIDDHGLKALYNLSLGYQYQYIDPVKTVEFALNSIELADQKKDSSILCQAHLLMGIIHRNKMDLESAMESYTASLEIAKVIDDSLQLAKSLNGIGIVHMMSARYDEGLEY